MRSQHGNALFLILIAVALFAALSYAVTQSGRGSGTVDKETAMIAASRMTQYPAGLRTAITRMIITGTAATAVDFTAGTGTARVFSSTGGGAVDETPPSGVGGTGGGPFGGATGATANVWGYKDAMDAVNGYYVKDVGTNTNITGRDVLAYLNDISLSVCSQINKGLGLGTSPGNDGGPDGLDFALNAGKGDATYDDAGTWVFTGLPGAAFACVDTSGGGINPPYVYYHVLIEQ